MPLPETKDATRQNLTTIQVDSPQRCDLTLLGGDEVCPPGSVLKLVRQDPAPDERVWNVMLKSTGALSKEKAIADFRLKGDQLSFQWQKLSGGSLLPAIMFCLLRIDAAGEQELCQLCKPLTSTPLPLKLADRWTIEAQIPGNALGTLPVRAEPLAIDFPNVNIPGASTLAAGETTTFKISGQASGSLAVDLELELKLEQKDGKLQLIIVPYSEPPNVARADRPPMRAVISPTQIKRRKAELTKASAVAESQAKTLKTQFERSERDEQTLSATIPMNINQRTLLSQQLLQVRQQIAIIEPKLDEAETTHKTLHAAAAWYTDMVTLLEQLQNQSKLGLRLFRTVGTERIVIAEPVANP